MSTNNHHSEVVMITGASAGIGRATARAFAKRGCKIGLFARGGDRLKAARAEVEEAGGRGLVLAGDVADDKAIEKTAQQLEEEFGPIDIWVNNAMVSVFSSIAEMTPREYKRVTEVTYLGRNCYQSQQTDEPDDPNRANNLFDPVPGDFGAHGAFDDQARKFSLQLWLDKHRDFLAGALLIPAAAIACLLLLSKSTEPRP